MFGKKRYGILKINNNGVISTLYPGDKYQLDIAIDFAKDKTTINGRFPITLLWDGETLTKIEGP
jgi:hypothetical protein